MDIIIFLLSISFAIIFGLRNLYNKKSLPKPIILVLYLVISIIGFYLVSLFTISPNVTSGNGNLALLFIPIALAFYITLVATIVKESNRLIVKLSMPFIVILVFVSCILLYLIIQEEIEFIYELYAALGGYSNNPNSKIYRYGLLNQYTNTIFFNFFTYCGGILVGLIVNAGRILFSYNAK